MGFEYLTASTKEEYIGVIDRLTSIEIGNRPLIVEAFTTKEDEYAALERLRNVVKDTKSAVKEVVKDALGQRVVDNFKRVIRG